MTPHPPGAAAIAREFGRIRRLRRQRVYPGYRAIIATAYQLGLPKRFATDLTILDRIQLMARRPQQFAWLLHECGSLLCIPEPNERPLDYLHAAQRLYPNALPFWWDGSELIRTERMDELIERMAAACAELHQKARELL